MKKNKNKKHEPRRLAMALGLLEKQQEDRMSGAPTQKRKNELKRLDKKEEQLLRKMHKDGWFPVLFPGL